MAIAVPNLDDRSYADLVDDARALIPVFDPSWTNHNESDPGITLLELFAWLTEMQIYALDQITDEHRVTFLRLLRGPELEPDRNPDGTVDGIWLEQETANALGLMRDITRAVSAADYEKLACRVPGVKRARCVPRRNLDAGSEAAALAPAPGHVSLVILQADRLSRNVDALCSTVRQNLEPARMLTTRLHVVSPTWAPVATRIMVARRSDIRPDVLEASIQDRLAGWLDPWTGGDGDGWRFGRNVYVSELVAALEAIRGIDYVGDAMLDSQAAFGAPRQQAAQPIWHDTGAQVGLALADHHLPLSPKDAHQIVVADGLEPVSITVHVTPTTAGAPDPATTRRIFMQTVRDFLWSLQKSAYGGSKGALQGNQPIVLSEGDIRNALEGRRQVTDTASAFAITIVADPAKRDPNASTAVYSFPAGNFFYADCSVEIVGATA